MSNTSSYVCPNCGTVTDGVSQSNQCRIICPNCLKNGATIVMVESDNNVQYNNMGDGLFRKG